MRKFLLLHCLIIICCSIKAQIKKYELGLVADSIKAGASVIKREENIFFEVTDIDRAYLTVHKVLTITGVKGQPALLFNEYSNSFIDLTDAEIKVFDATGKQTAKIKKRDMSTVAIGDGLVEEGKVTFFKVATEKYPISVEFNYEIKFKGTLIYPNYEILTAGEGVENSNFTAKVPTDLDLRYKEKNTLIKPEITVENKYKIYRWSVNNIPPFEYEPGSVSYSSRYPQVILAPNRFKIYNVEGDMTSWKNFGFWESSLIKGLAEIPEERKAFFRNMVKDAKDDKEKIKLVYEYLQKNFRYVSIQLGIGGFKPFPALFTDQKKYGDCKGLSFYTYSILNILGIKSYMALINAEYDKEPVDPGFPCNQFNHAILCVPAQKDTMWLECTSRTNDFGVLGSFTENRNALLITEDGGQLVATPKSKSSENIFAASTIVALKEDGSGIAKIRIEVKGEYKQEFIHYLLEEKKDDQKDFLINKIGLKQPDDFTVSKNDTADKFLAVVECEFEKIPEFTVGSKMFLRKRIYKLFAAPLPKSTGRKFDFYFKCPFEKTDTTLYKLPPGYIADGLPEAKKISCDYGEYSTKYWYNKEENTVYSSAKLLLRNNKIPASKYAEVKSFFDNVENDEAQNIVVKKQ